MIVPRSHGFQERFESSWSSRLIPSPGWASRACGDDATPRRRLHRSQTDRRQALSPRRRPAVPGHRMSGGPVPSTGRCPSVRARGRRPNWSSAAAMIRTLRIPSRTRSASDRRNPEGPNLTAIFTRYGARTANPAVAISAATNEPIAAVASAGPPRPARAILLPSSAVTTDALSPGVFSRIAVVEPPYMPAVVNSGEHDDRTAGSSLKVTGSRSATVSAGPDAWENTDGRSNQDANGGVDEGSQAE